MAPEHYEVELREITYADSGDGILQITGESWWPVRVFRGDNFTTPLVFGSLDEARGCVGRDRTGAVRMVRVMEEGEQKVIEAEGA